MATSGSPRARKRDPNALAELALAIAAGESVAKFAAARKIPERTAYMWASLPEVRADVREIRARLTDEAVGKLASLAASAVAVLGRLAESAEGEGVRLGAARAILGELVAVSNWSEIGRRLEALEGKLDEIGTRPA